MPYRVADPSRVPLVLTACVAVVTLSLTSVLSGCNLGVEQKSGPIAQNTPPVAPATPPKPKPQPVDLKLHRPNELGRIPILEYHHIEPKEARWTRTPDNFSKDLEKLHKLGYYPISMTDYVNGKIDVPPGRSPVVFTFDDSDPGQFRYLGTGPNAKLDPDCAVAIMLDFAKKHPDFPAKATFYVLPSLFEQPEFKERKLRELREWGFEIGNHTYSHHQLRKLSREEGMKEIAKGVGVTKAVLPDYEVQTIALPNGSIPKDDSILRQGSAEGITYRHSAALLVGAEPAPSPFSEKFKPYRIPRIQATDTVEPGITDWLSNLEKRGKFRSDGDPGKVTFPEDLEEHLRAGGLGGRTVQKYNPDMMQAKR